MVVLARDTAKMGKDRSVESRIIEPAVLDVRESAAGLLTSEKKLERLVERSSPR